MKQTGSLWIGVLAGPIIWLCSFQARYAWVPWTCTFQNKFALFLIALVSLLLTGAAGLVAWRQWRALGLVVPGDEGGSLPRSRFMALGGMVFSGAFTLIIVAQTIPELMLASCD